ncbi:MAG: hypothetical protein LBM70_03135 [Victivallales bacterium]|jgi:hypothetical protein|nr:hypothetical protein [Victivallales bacterium]
MSTICPYCNIEVSESAIEAEDGCCPECGSVISASSSFLGEDFSEFERDPDDDALFDEFDDDEDDIFDHDDFNDELDDELDDDLDAAYLDDGLDDEDLDEDFIDEP